jgi:hypothetical protein
MKWKSLRSLLVWIGVNTFDSLQSKRALYVSAIFVSAAIASMSSVVTKEVYASILSAQAFAVMIDETTDVSIFKQLIIYLRTVTHGRVNTRFAAVLRLGKDGTANSITKTVHDFLVKLKVDMRKVTFL